MDNAMLHHRCLLFVFMFIDFVLFHCVVNTLTSSSKMENAYSNPKALFANLLENSILEWVSVEELLKDLKTQLGEEAENYLEEQVKGMALPNIVHVSTLLGEIAEVLDVPRDHSQSKVIAYKFV